MNANTLIAIALAALLVFAGGAAAMPGQATDNPGSDTADDHAPDDPASEAEGNATETDDDVNETERDENATDAPPTELPEQAPDRVGEIHDLIRSLSGHELGHALSGLLGGSDQADAAGEGSENASDTSDDARSDAEDADESAQSSDERAGPPSSLPEQAADRVSQIHDAIVSFLDGDGDGDPGDAVSTAAQG